MINGSLPTPPWICSMPFNECLFFETISVLLLDETFHHCCFKSWIYQRSPLCFNSYIVLETYFRYMYFKTSPLFCCMSCEPPEKGSGWAGFIVLWCRAESELVLVRKQKEELCFEQGGKTWKMEHSGAGTQPSFWGDFRPCTLPFWWNMHL